MMQVIAVHCGGTLPVAMEFATTGLNFVQQHALKFLPRSPSGVPELRALGKGDGEVQFRFKVPADKLSPDALPELLTQWDAKFTVATLKRIARQHADERKAASAAGLWKGDGDKADLTAMHAQCSPHEAHDFSEALATVVQKKARVSTGPKRTPKPKVLDAVVEASTAINTLTGELTAIASASERAVSTLRAREIVKLIAGAGEGSEDLVNPLENARLQDGPDLPESVDGDQSTMAAKPAALPDAAGHDADVPPWKDGFSAEFPGDQARSTYMSGAAKVLGVLQAHKEGKSAGPRLIELSVGELKRLARGGAAEGDDVAASPAPKMPVSLDAGAAQADRAAGATKTASTENQLPFEHRIAVDIGHPKTLPEAFDLFEGYGEPVFFEKQEPAAVALPVAAAAILDTPVQQAAVAVAPGEDLQACSVKHPFAIDWSGISSFRLSSSATNGHAVVLQSGEVFEALAHLDIAEPLAINTRWFLDACQEDGVLVEGADLLAAQTGWLREQLRWRNKQLMRWLGKADLVSPVVALKRGEKPKKSKKSRRPAGWVAAGVDLASLAQDISMDIAMLDMTLQDIERAITGMPSWAIEILGVMREFNQSDADADAGAGAAPGGPGAAFRDAWRAELLLIDRWCAAFKPIKIVRQLGLFASAADQKSLLRLEDMITRTQTWSAAPAQASRVLAVWVGFVLSLDHAAVALAGQCRPVAGGR